MAAARYFDMTPLGITMGPLPAGSRPPAGNAPGVLSQGIRRGAARPAGGLPAYKKVRNRLVPDLFWRAWRDSNPRPSDS